MHVSACLNAFMQLSSIHQGKLAYLRNRLFNNDTKAISKFLMRSCRRTLRCQRFLLQSIKNFKLDITHMVRRGLIWNQLLYHCDTRPYLCESLSTIYLFIVFRSVSAKGISTATEHSDNGKHIFISNRPSYRLSTEMAFLYKLVTKCHTEEIIATWNTDYFLFITCGSLQSGSASNDIPFSCLMHSSFSTFLKGFSISEKRSKS